MRPSVVILLTLACAASVAQAQTGLSASLTQKQQLGRRLFGQDCGICHTPPTMTSKVFGPVLSRAVVKGNEATIAKFISDGSSRMPGFKYYYTPAQIEAIVDYLDTIAPPAAGPSTPGSK